MRRIESTAELCREWEGMAQNDTQTYMCYSVQHDELTYTLVTPPLNARLTADTTPTHGVGLDLCDRSDTAA